MLVGFIRLFLKSDGVRMDKKTNLSLMIAFLFVVYMLLGMTDKVRAAIEIVNGGFELPADTPWAQAEGWNGNCRVNINNRGQHGNNANTKDSTCIVYQDLAAKVVAGRRYVLTFYRKQLPDSKTYHNGNVSMDAQLIFGGKIVTSTGPVTRDQVKPRGLWNKYTISYTAHPEDAGKSIQIAFDIVDLSELAGSHGREKYGHAYAMYDTVTLTDGTPVITEISPSFADPKLGGQVIIYGSDLDTVTQIEFGDSTVSASTFISQSKNQIILPAPSHAEEVVDVKVTNPLGTFILHNGFKYKIPTIFYVAPNGSDSNPGTKSRPFRTIQKAANMMQSGDTCYVREGVYHETVSGKLADSITFKAYLGEKVILDGTEPIVSEWTKYKGKIYKTKLDKDIWQLFVDGKMMVEARWPNQSFEQRWDKSTWRTVDKGSDYGVIVDDELAKTRIDWTGAFAVLNVGAHQTFLRQIKNYQPGSNCFEYDKDMGRRLEIQRRNHVVLDRYFLFGKLEALDSPGEWFFEQASRTLYLWPPDGKEPSTYRINGKNQEYAFIIKGLNHIRIIGFNFFATTFLFEGTNDCLVEDCDLRFPTYAGRVAAQDAETCYVPAQCRKTNGKFLAGICVLSPTLLSGQGNVVRNCRIAFSEAPAIMMTGRDNTIENCLMHDVDWRGLGNGVAGNLGGVHMGSSATSIFRRNTVYNIGSSEAVILPWKGPSLCEYNYIHHGGLVQSDGALIQCGGRRLNGTEIRRNWVHDHNAFNWGGNGIRGDDLTMGLIVHHNVAWNCRNKGIIVKGDKNRIYNNTCINNHLLDLLVWKSPTPEKKWVRGRIHIKKQNANSETINNYAPVLSGLQNWEVRRKRRILRPLGKLENNHTGGKSMLIDASKPSYREDELHVLVNPANYDFRPKDNSPLIDAGKAIPSFTDGYRGKTPDIGAYEYGDPNYWIPGYQTRKASRPIPSDKFKYAKLDTDIIWLEGYKATLHDIYFGTDFNAVAKANHDFKEYKGRQANNIFSPGKLKKGKTYYWRIDAIGKTGEVVTGDVWGFTVNPLLLVQLQAKQDADGKNKRNRQAKEIIVLANRAFRRGGYDNYKECVKLCRKVLQDYSDTRYANHARRLLRRIPLRYRQDFKITKKEMGR